MIPTKKWKQLTLAEELAYRANAGKEGAICVQRSSKDGTLNLCFGSRTAPIVSLHLNLRTGHGPFVASESDFGGVLLLDGHGERGQEARLVLCDESRKTIVTSDAEEITGNIFIVAAYGAEQATPFTYSALFKNTATDKRSSVRWAMGPDWLSYAALEDELFQGGSK